MKRKGGNDDKQRTISHFFKTSAANVSKPAAQPHKAAAPVQPHAEQTAALETPPKRQKLSQESDVVIIDELDHSNDQETAATSAADVTDAVRATTTAAQLAAIPANRSAARHNKAQRKLVGSISATSLAEPGPASTQAARAGTTVSSTVAGGASRRQQQQPTYTPLEKQVVKLKEANPGVLLVVEVGYKFRFFGDDAAVAAQELGLYCYSDHNFLTASFPVQRLPVHIRRLVAAGHKVGVVRQVESAALKAVSDNKSAPFERQLTGLFTAATLDAGEKADKLGEAGAMEASQELESLLGAAAAAAATNYILVIAEQQQQQQQQDDDGTANGNNSSSISSCGVLGVLAVDVGSGDIAYGLCSSRSSSSSGGGDGSSDGGSTGSSVVPLEAVLLSFAPADIVIVEPVSATTNRLLSSYMAGSSRKCRLERQQQQLGSSNSSSQGYLDAATLNELQEFYTASSSDQQPIDADHDHQASATTAAAGSSSDDLQFILSLPHMVLRALWGALQYLRAFGLTSVLQCTSGFRLLGVGRHIKLDGNALRQLQILSTGVDASGSSSSSSVQGSLLHLLDRCSTAAGGRLLRRWLSAPLADRNMILDRQEAVQALLAASQGAGADGGGSSSSSSSSKQLSTLRSWLKSQRTDHERCLSRITAGTAAPAEAVALWTTLSTLLKSLKLPHDPETRQLDLTALAAAVPSRLLVSLLSAAAGSSAVAAAAEVLGWLDAAAATKNDYLGVFESGERFPEVFKCAAAVAAAEQHLHELLPELAAAARVPSLTYVAVQNQGSWMVELPTSRTDIPQGWEKVCGTKKVNRFHSPEVKAGVAALARAQEVQQATCQTAWQDLLKGFMAKHYTACRECVSAIAELDALQALAEVASTPGYCRPSFAADDEPQQLIITDGKHAMLDLVLDGAAVANSLGLKWDGVRAAVITGPNMGGKSVVIRQAAVTVIMAQLGSWVPAASCHLSVFDGVFSRMGASDSLMLGRSTFAEELEDASYILQHATNRSLVIIDELGRGTATHDGVAIATATLQHLVAGKQCLTLFVTHYPEVAALADNAGSSSSSASGSSDPASAAAAEEGKPSAASSAGISAVAGHLAVYHMSYVRQDTPAVSTAEDAAVDSGAATAAAAAIPVITFLYKLTPGAADASFGLNVAQMAGLPQTVVQKAACIASQLKARIEQQQQQQQQQGHNSQLDEQQRHQEQLQQQVTAANGLMDGSSPLQSLQGVIDAVRGVVPQLQQQQQHEEHEQQQHGSSAGALDQLIHLQDGARAVLAQV